MPHNFLILTRQVDNRVQKIRKNPEKLCSLKNRGYLSSRLSNIQ